MTWQLNHSAYGIASDFWSKLPTKFEIKNTRQVGGLVFAAYSRLFVRIQAKWLRTSKKISPVTVKLEDSWGHRHEGWLTTTETDVSFGDRRLFWIFYSSDIKYSYNIDNYRIPNTPADVFNCVMDYKYSPCCPLCTSRTISMIFRTAWYRPE